MKLSQLDGSKPVLEKRKEPDKYSPEIIQEIKVIQQQMHKTMLVADTLMRRLNDILDKQ